MSAENVKVVRSLYEAFAKGDIPTIIGALDPKVEWWEAENFIYADGNPYVGPEAVLQGVFMRIGTEWEGFAVSPSEVLDAGQTVIGHGYTAGRSSRAANTYARNLLTSLLSVKGRL